MHDQLLVIFLRNLLVATLFMVAVMSPNTHLVRQELQRIWKTIKTPLLQLRITRTNHKSNKFWEIDMTKFEP